MSRVPSASAGFATVVAALLVTACGSQHNGAGAADVPDPSGSSSSPDQGFDGRTFVSTSVARHNQPFDLVHGTTVSITLTGGGIRANAGCNQLMGKAHLDGDVLVVTGLGSTEMGCDQARMDQDVWLGELLQARPKVSVEADRMTLSTAQIQLQLVDQAAGSTSLDLVGPLWSLDSYSAGGGPSAAVSSLPTGITSTLVFSADRVTARPGCNTGSATVTISGSMIDVGPLMLTRMACEASAMETEAAVVQALDGVVSYRIEGDLLTLSGARGVLTYRGS